MPDEIKITFPSQFVGPKIHNGLIWVTNASRDDEWANVAIVEGRLHEGPARATLTFSTANLETEGIVGLYGEPIPELPTVAPPALASTFEYAPAPQPEPAGTKKRPKAKPSLVPKPANLKVEEPAALTNEENPAAPVQETFF